MKHRSLLTLLFVFCLVPGPVDAADGVFDSNGVKIRYVTEGTGEAVVLIHGWMGDSSMWGQDPSGNTRLNAANGFQLIALDCRGHGKSDKPHDPEKYGPEMAAGRGFKKLDVSVEQLAKCKAPILFIHGGNESDHVKNRVATVRGLLGRGELKIVDGGDHMTTLIKPELASAVLEFLRSAKPG